ncbi:hypothetical protein BAUCODRAFT_151412 [Baudoinia panamericana UAMH 10762]|uniref:Uncharacterized protein n=1 Tax=Baudoinia panamericana (strain UAMH 10762) TaxID=717646 RepID=M2N2Z8_BAUPA|nr:uncharacterized protein BAUCODRAFT_151412 [Baudoinia panamericana UAMH 10762]EMC93040.1 hypothetical protein BAUCODRAFT_151412 [Baudoinia panamericana UAMH 10762]
MPLLAKNVLKELCPNSSVGEDCKVRYGWESTGGGANLGMSPVLRAFWLVTVAYMLTDKMARADALMALFANYVGASQPPDYAVTIPQPVAASTTTAAPKLTDVMGDSRSAFEDVPPHCTNDGVLMNCSGPLPVGTLQSPLPTGIVRSAASSAGLVVRRMGYTTWVAVPLAAAILYGFFTESRHSDRTIWKRTPRPWCEV